MGELAASPPPRTVLPPVDLQQGVVGLTPNQISARPRRVPPLEREEATDAAARDGSGCYALRRSRRGGRSRRDKKQQPPKPKQQQRQPPEKTILKRLSPTDLASLAAAPVMFGARDYEAHLRELQLQREWYLMNTAAPDPYFPLAPELVEDPPLLWSPRCHECEAAAAAMRQPPFHRCVRDAVTVGFRSHVGPIERPARKTPSPPPASPGRMPAFFGMSVY